MQKIKLKPENQGRELSQRIYNLSKIIDAHCWKPIEVDKKLNGYFLEEREKLIRMSKPAFSKKVLTALPNSLLANKLETDTARKQIDDARDFLSLHLGNIQAQRHLDDPTYKPSTGMEEGSLKQYVSFIRDKKGVKEEIKSISNIFGATEWNQITIEFLNGQEVRVIIGNESHQTDCTSLGFTDSKTKRPNKQWEVLQLLSIREGVMSWNNNSNLSLKEINKFKKRKQLLKRKLCDIFGINSDPFEPYRKVGSYRIKINLIPEVGTEI